MILVFRLCAVLREAAIRISLYYAGAAGVSKNSPN
jgi:hypothetical protein